MIWTGSASVDPTALNLNPRGANGNGASLTLQAFNGDISVKGSIGSDGVGTGDGGSLVLDFFGPSSGPFTIGMGPTANGVAGSIHANSGLLGGSGGIIGLGGNGNPIQFKSPSDVSVNNVSGNGGSIGMQGTLDIPAGTISVDASPGNFNGGSISLVGEITTTGTGPLILSANASGSGRGGNVTFTSVNSDETIGTGTGQLQMYARGWDGVLSLGGINLTVNPTFFNASPLTANSAGPSLSIISYGGHIFVTQSLSADGRGSGNGGFVSIQAANSTNSLTIGSGVTSDGVNGTVTANAGPLGGAGGDVQILSNNAITLLSGSPVQANGTTGSGGTIFLASTVALNIGPGSINADGGTTGGHINIGTGVLNVTGPEVISANGQSAGGQIVINANATNVTGGALSISATGLLSGGSVHFTAGSNTVSTGSGPGQVNFDVSGGSGGTLQLSASSIIADQAALKFGPTGPNGNGGSLFLNGNLQVTNALSANGAGSGNGGTISLTNSSPAWTIGVPLTADAGPSGSRGGSISVSAPASITTLSNGALFSAVAAAGSGGTISLSTNQLSLTGVTPVNVDATGGTNGAGGSVSVQSTSTTSDLAVGSSAGQLIINAQGGSGGTVNISSGRNLFIDPSSLIAGPLSVKGSGAHITLSASQFILSASGPTILSADGNGVGIGGSISLQSTSNLSIGSGAGQFMLSAQGLNGGTISVTSAGTISLDPTALVANALVSGGSGGHISLSAAQFLLPSSGPAILSVNGNGTGNGGSVSLQSTSTSADLAIGSSAGQFTIDAQGGPGGGNGGIVNIRSGRDLLVDTSALNVNPIIPNGSGANITLWAGRNLVMNGSLSADSLGSGNGGSIFLTYGGSTSVPGPFVVGGAITNSGITGSLSANAPGSGLPGNITIVNGTGTAQDIQLTGTISATSGTGQLGAVTLGGSLQSSNISGTGSLVGQIKLQGLSGLATINLPNQATPLTLGSINGGGSLTVDAPLVDVHSGASVSLTGGITINGQTLTVQQNALVSSTGGFTINAQTVNLQSNAVVSSPGSSTITAPNVNVQLGATLSSSAGMTINSGNVVNDGILESLTPGATITIQNPSGLTVSGNGLIIATNIVFNSSNGSVAVNQGQIIGNFSGSASGTFVVVNGNSLTTAAALSLAGISTSSGTLSFGSAAPPASTTIGSSNDIHSSAIAATDTVRRDLSATDSAAESSVANEVFMGSVGGNDDSYAVGDENTQIQNQPDRVILGAGRLTIDSGSKSTVVETPIGTVTIAPNAAAVIDAPSASKCQCTSTRCTNVKGCACSTHDCTCSSTTKPLRVMAVAGGQTAVTVGKKIGDKANVGVKAGEELIVADSALSDEELIPVDGIERGEVISANISIASGTTVKRTFNLQEFHQKQIMVAGHMIQVGSVQNARRERLNNHIAQAASAQQFHSVGEPNVVHSLASSEHSASSNAGGIATSVGSDIVLREPGTQMMYGDHIISVSRGEIFVAPDQQVTVNTPIATVFASRTAMVSTEVIHDVVRIKACGPDDITIVIAQRKMQLHPGQEATVSSRALNDDDLRPSDGIGRRAPATRTNIGNKFVCIADFSLLSMITSKRYVPRLGTTAAAADKRRLENSMLKTVAALNMVQAHKGGYNSKSAPSPSNKISQNPD
jgi:hypothetical protein